VEIHVTYGGI